MKKNFITCFLLWFHFLLLYSQHVENNESGHFLKRIEYNLRNQQGYYNDASKGDIEKLFFGNFLV